jgi:hypothetical protein
MKKIFLLMVMLLCCIASFAQTTPIDTASYKKSVEFLQGNGVYEQGMMVFLSGLKESIWSHFDLFITDAKALAAIFMIIFFAIKSYEMMSGDKQLEVMPLLRPFGLAMVILWWGAFAKVVAFPTDLVANQTQQMFESEQGLVNSLRIQRANLMLAVANSLYKYQAQTEVAEKESDTWYGQAWDSVTSTVKQGISDVISPVLELKNRLTIGMQLLVTQLLELTGIWILRIAVYIVFMIQIIYSSILIILGPFAVAVSILPAFRDSFSTWIARFVSVNLYSGIGYLIMYLCGLMQEYALQSKSANTGNWSVRTGQRRTSKRWPGSPPTGSCHSARSSSSFSSARSACSPSRAFRPGSFPHRASVRRVRLSVVMGALL